MHCGAVDLPCAEASSVGCLVALDALVRSLVQRFAGAAHRPPTLPRPDPAPLSAAEPPSAASTATEPPPPRDPAAKRSTRTVPVPDPAHVPVPEPPSAPSAAAVPPPFRGPAASASPPPALPQSLELAPTPNPGDAVYIGRGRELYWQRELVDLFAEVPPPLPLPSNAPITAAEP